MRPRMNDVRSYVAPFTLGEAMTGGAVGQVVVSHNEVIPRGAGWCTGSAGASGRCRRDPASTDRRLRRTRVDRARGARNAGADRLLRPVRARQPKEGETVFVSGAAGAVGSTAGQMAKIAGCRVIGSAGSDEKLAWLRELGFDAVFNYRERRAREALAELAPDGIDIYFDNVGGDHLEAAIGALRTYGRVVACGSISRYNDVEPTPGPRNMFMVVTKRLRIQGYIISDHFDRFGEFYARGAGVGSRRPPPLSRDDHRGDRERPARLPRAAPRREHREDAREGRPGRVKPLPDPRPPAPAGAGRSSSPSAYQRCERCGKRDSARGR